MNRWIKGETLIVSCEPVTRWGYSLVLKITQWSRFHLDFIGEKTGSARDFTCSGFRELEDGSGDIQTHTVLLEGSRIFPFCQVLSCYFFSESWQLTLHLFLLFYICFYLLSFLQTFLSEEFLFSLLENKEQCVWKIFPLLSGVILFLNFIIPAFCSYSSSSFYRHIKHWPMLLH